MTDADRVRLAAACDEGAAYLEGEAAGLAGSDPERAAGKLAAARTVRTYAGEVRSGRVVSVDAAERVALCARMSGILIDPDPRPSTPLSVGDDYAGQKAVARALVDAGVFVRVAEPGQVAFHALAGYHPARYASEPEERYERGRRDGRAAEVDGHPYDAELFGDDDYRRGLQDGRTAYIDERLTARVGPHSPSGAWGSVPVAGPDPDA